MLAELSVCMDQILLSDIHLLKKNLVTVTLLVIDVVKSEEMVYFLQNTVLHYPFLLLNCSVLSDEGTMTPLQVTFIYR